MISQTCVASFCSPDHAGLLACNVQTKAAAQDDLRNIFLRYQKKHFSMLNDFAQHLIVIKLRLPLWIFGGTKKISHARAPNSEKLQKHAVSTTCRRSMRTNRNRVGRISRKFWIPSNQFVVLRRGHNVASGRIWTPQQQAAAKKLRQFPQQTDGPKHSRNFVQLSRRRLCPNS